MMAVKSTLLLLVSLVVFTELPCSSSFQITKYPPKPLVVYYSNKTNVELRWEWDLPSGVMTPLKIRRYRKDNLASTEVLLATYSSGNKVVDETKYSFNVVNSMKGYASLVIKDILNQGNNEDDSKVDVMKDNEAYIYTIEMDVTITSTVQEHKDQVELKMLKVPVITTSPRNQTVSEGTVTFKCAANGKPTPVITWEKIGSSQPLLPGSPLTINNFAASDIGVYRCTAKSTGITQNATATATVQFSTCGSGCTKEELGIQFPDLTYNYEYENPSYNKYKELKNKIETACLTEYALKSKTIHKCEVVRYRQGSVVAVVELGWPAGAVDPKEPLLEAIRDGNFAGYKVKNDFVSPTSPPTSNPPSTLTTTQPTPSGGSPNKGQRTESGLSQGAIIALVVVFSIIFLVIIVVLIVCMLKRKKPSDTRKPYKEDGRSDKPTATVPLKSQPFDPTYDDPNENRKEVVYADLTFQDRYPNGGGPPPQYTPSSNYADVRPNQQDDSQVEWDKSVKEKDEMWI